MIEPFDRSDPKEAWNQVGNLLDAFEIVNGLLDMVLETNPKALSAAQKRRRRVAEKRYYDIDVKFQVAGG